MKTNPIEILIEIEQIVRTFGTKETSQFFENGLARYMANGGTLEESFQMKTSPGKESFRRKYLELKRNNHLIAAHALCDGDLIWHKSKNLSKEVKHFKAVIWPRIKDEQDPPPRLSDLRRQLFHAFKTNIEPPYSARQLHDIATSHIF